MVVNVHEAKTHLSRLLHRVASGEEIVIANAGVPVARLVPVELSKSRRKLGVDKGKIWIADDFDAPLPEIEALLVSDKNRSRRRSKRG